MCARRRRMRRAWTSRFTTPLEPRSAWGSSRPFRRLLPERVIQTPWLRQADGALVAVTRAVAALTVVNVAWRGLGAPFAGKHRERSGIRHKPIGGAGTASPRRARASCHAIRNRRRPGGASRSSRYGRRPKARWARPGKGKSGGVRVIYYYWRTIEEITTQVLDPEVYLLSIYAKSDRSDMTAADRKAARKFVEGFKHAKKQADK